MAKQKGKRSFMELSRKECSEASLQLLQNADSLYKDAQLLASNNSYGRATSMLIHSTEETMKAIILFLDSKGFLFRNKVKGIGGLFTNHSLRYALALLLSIFYIFSADLKKLISAARNNPQLLTNLNENQGLLKEEVFGYFKIKIQMILEEVIWFSKVEFIRQDGFYVDYVDEIKTPLNVSREEYLSVLLRVDNMNSVAAGIMTTLESEDEAIAELMEVVKNKYMESLYMIFSMFIDKYKERKANPLDNLAECLSRLSKELAEAKSFEELI